MPSPYYLQNKVAYWTNLKLAAQEIGIPYMWLHAIIWIETDRSLDPLKHNGIGYRGLCQWGPAASSDLGYSSSLALVTQNNTYEKQFKIVVQWYKLNIQRHGNKYQEVAFYYCLNFMPAKVAVWGNNANRIASASQNPFLDFDSNGTITVGDLKNRLAETQKEVLVSDKKINDFLAFKELHEEQNQIDFPENFTISPFALKKAKKDFRHDLKLDNHVVVKILRNDAEFTRGFDELRGRKFYQFFFDEEN